MYWVVFVYFLPKVLSETSFKSFQYNTKGRRLSNYSVKLILCSHYRSRCKGLCQNKMHEFDQYTKGGHFCAAHMALTGGIIQIKVSLYQISTFLPIYISSYLCIFSSLFSDLGTCESGSRSFLFWNWILATILATIFFHIRTVKFIFVQTFIVCLEID